MILNEARGREILYTISGSETNQPSITFYKNPYYKIMEQVFQMFRDGTVPKRDSPLFEIFIWFVSGLWSNSTGCSLWEAIEEHFDLEELQGLINLQGAPVLTQCM